MAAFKFLKAMGDQLSEDQVAVFFFAFCLQASDADGKLQTNKIAGVLRSLGHVVSEAELARIIKQTDKHKKKNGCW